MAASRFFDPSFQAAPYWWDAAPPEDASNQDLPARTDLVIIGSGFAGLSAALEAARAGASVAVLDAGPLGGGASSRSGGMVSSGQKLVLTAAIAGLSAAQAQAALEDSKATYEFLQALIAREGLDADLQLCGRFFGAFTPAHLARLHRNAEALATRTGVQVRVLSRAEQYEEVGSDYFHGGFVVADYGGVHPRQVEQGAAQTPHAPRAPPCTAMPASPARSGKPAVTVSSPPGVIFRRPRCCTPPMATPITPARGCIAGWCRS